MQSQTIIRVISIAQTYKCRPSELVSLEEPYLALCFDEACSFILNQIRGKKEPDFEKFKEVIEIYVG